MSIRHWLLLISLLAACSPETGILIETRAVGEYEIVPVSFRYYVGERYTENERLYSEPEYVEDIMLSGDMLFGQAHVLKILRSEDHVDRGALRVVAVAFDGEGNVVGAGAANSPTGDLYFNEGQMLLWHLEISPLTGDREAWVTDTGCLRWQDLDVDSIRIGRGSDMDCDGSSSDDPTSPDCDDLNPEVHPRQREDCENFLDDNCNGKVDWDDDDDQDEDGFVACNRAVPELSDCDDLYEFSYPGAPETCDARDNDCSGDCDDNPDLDPDGDGFTKEGCVVGRCHKDDTHIDCAPYDGAVNQDAVEVCNGIDDDCNGISDDGEALDPDGDGYTEEGCIVGKNFKDSRWADCEPMNPAIYPTAHEVCDGFDNNCDGFADPEWVPCFFAGASPETCHKSYQACAEGGLVGECVSKASLGLPPPDFPSEVCDEYASCDNDPAITDPFSCLLKEVTQQEPTEVCRVRMVGDTLCSPHIVRIPVANASNGDCTFTFLGGLNQQGHHLHLVTLTDPSYEYETVRSCNAGLFVNLVKWGGDALISIWATRPDGSGDFLYVQLIGEQVNTCSGVIGVECETWEPIYGLSPTMPPMPPMPPLSP